MSQQFDRQKNLEKVASTLTLSLGPRSVSVRPDANTATSQANRAALAHMTNFERITGRSMADFTDDMAAQRARCLARCEATSPA